MSSEQLNKHVLHNRSVFFIVGCRNDIRDKEQFHLRTLNVINSLSRMGAQVDYCLSDEAPARTEEILTYEHVVVVRAWGTYGLGLVLDKAEDRGIPLTFETDDLIFDPCLVEYFKNAKNLSNEQASHLHQSLTSYRATLERCSRVTVSTTTLAREVSALGKKAHVIRNALSPGWIEKSEKARIKRSSRKNGRKKVIGYFSGTRTHQKDFAVAVPALVKVLADFREVELMVTELIDLKDFPGLEPYSSRIKVESFVPWQELPAMMTKADINIVPLEFNRFCESKSELKYIHAASLEIPTVATPTRPFREAIEHNNTGLLARTEVDWYGHLKDLIEKQDLRRFLGENAYEHVMSRYGPEGLLQQVGNAYTEILGN
jgi:O-antigen biosynthesis protein